MAQLLFLFSQVHLVIVNEFLRPRKFLFISYKEIELKDYEIIDITSRGFVKSVAKDDDKPPKKTLSILETIQSLFLHLKLTY
jgi:hypothetical protein